MRRWTFFHHLPAAEAKAILVDSIGRLEGNVFKIARDVDLSRMHVYRLLHRWELWDAVDTARATRRRAAPEWRERARAALVARR